MASLTSEFSLAVMPGPKLVPNFSVMTNRKGMNTNAGIVYHDESNPEVVAEIEKRQKEFDCEKAVKLTRPGKREGLQMRLGIKREQHLFGTRQFGQDANLMKARHTQDLNSIEQINGERLDPSCCRRRVLGNHDMYMQTGRGASEKLRAESPPRQNPELMEKTKVYRELRPGEGKLSNIAELSKVAGDIKQLRRERKWIPLEEG
mmetsp:Transcript_8683/g.21007  ORF Transcript_8683/g.21007 Transcript_8683/m.21007 type:complete len:204 (-) Transcript_8683:242-853(-)|eukprot:CAMPEP_0179000058 /NCGR_PEP_ID=MMETSP0795-20121207/10446_1 /TAXON_ID=88552 /ORGANISM="Amoebophrya sp., Strain Ameob2" /LENGTH=203 /DNA_ID=CAMNT_0020692983 /DNA_START=205 /DNA_END=816 /DNA_ORIENTATION=+